MKNFYILHVYEYNTKIIKLQPLFDSICLAPPFQYVNMQFIMFSIHFRWTKILIQYLVKKEKGRP